MTAQPSRYAAFVSYAHRDLDRTWAAWISGTLETWRTPKLLVERGHTRRLGRVFRDEEELAAAPNLPAAIQAALRTSDHLIVVCSPAAAQSRWVNDEIDYFRSLGREDRIVALLVDGDAARSRPPALEAISDVRFVDVRDAKGASLRYRRQSARLALVGAVLGCPDEELQEREAERRLRRVAFATIASVLLAVAATALVLFSFEQQAAAEEARLTEADRLHRASELTSFMTYDLYQRLVPIGRLDLLGEVSRELAAYYDTLPQRHRTIAERLKDVGVQKRLGWVLASTGDTEGALDRHEARRRIAEELLASDPSNPDFAAEVVDAAHGVAGTRLHRGEYGIALGLYNESLRIVEEHARVHPGHRRLQISTAYQLSGVAQCLLKQGALRGARIRYEQAIPMWADLAATAEGGLWKKELAVGHLALGDVAKASGSLPAAIRSYRVGLGIITSLVERDERDFEMQDRLAYAQNHLSNALAQSGDVAPALDAARAALATRERLVAQDPLNTSWRRDLTTTLFSYESLLELLGREDEALELATRASNMTRELSALDPANTAWRKNVVDAQAHLASLWLNRGRLDDAEAALHIALEARAGLEAAGGATAASALGRVSLLRTLANLEFHRGNVSAAIRIYEEALSEATAARDAAPDFGDAALAEVMAREELAHLHGIAGALDAARTHFERARTLVEDLVSRDPTNIDWRQAYATELMLEGRHLAREAPEEALPVLWLAEDQAEELVDRAPLDARYFGGLVEARQEIGTLLIDLGRSVEGEVLFRATAAAVAELDVERISPDRNLMHLADAIASIADIITIRGDPLLGAETFVIGIRCLGRLLRSQPDRLDWKIRMGRWESFAASAFIGADRGDRAEGLLETARVRMAEVIETDPTSVSAYDVMGLLLHFKANLLEKDRIDGAISTYREAIRVMHVGLELDPNSRDLINNLHVSWVKIGAALMVKGDLDGAMEAAAEATRLEVEALEREMARDAEKPEGPEDGK